MKRTALISASFCKYLRFSLQIPLALSFVVLVWFHFHFQKRNREVIQSLSTLFLESLLNLYLSFIYKVFIRKRNEQLFLFWKNRTTWKFPGSPFLLCRARLKFQNVAEKIFFFKIHPVNKQKPHKAIVKAFEPRKPLLEVSIFFDSVNNLLLPCKLLLQVRGVKTLHFEL